MYPLQWQIKGGGHSWHAKTLAKLYVGTSSFGKSLFRLCPACHNNWIILVAGITLYETTVRKFALILSILFSYPKAHVDQNGYLVPPGSSTISSSALSTIGAHMAGI